MSRVAFTVNGEAVAADVTPRTHLADFLREDRLLTGTHLGCEHGVCGACTLLIDGAPARSCIAFAAACDGADVRTIEGLEDDPVIVRLRAAFTADHALQCGYCTPGMLVTARDIVLRLPAADEARIRLELAGNLCRCTGYAGIVRAIQRVLAEGIVLPPPVQVPLPALPLVHAARPVHMPRGAQLSNTIQLAVPVEMAWSALQDPKLLAGCVPGARLLSIDGEHVRGEVQASLGPIVARFTGEGRIRYDAPKYRAEIEGDGRDSRTGTRLSGRAVLQLRAAGSGATEATVTVEHVMRGPLAQFARGAVVEGMVAELSAMFAANLEARLLMRDPQVRRPLSLGRLMLRAVWRRMRSLVAAR
ncbi:MAG: 2Fe-2S iron-sulfur cluster-binding protein [Acetobacteraceae bacterium]